MVFVVMRQQYRQQAEIVGLYTKMDEAVKAREASFQQAYKAKPTSAPACWIEQKTIQ